MSRFRYRHLTAVRDPEAIAAMKDDFRRQAIRRSDYVTAGARAENEAPVQVLADESEGSLEEITRMLQEGELMPSDLVFSNGSWTTFDQSAEFFEACEGQVDTRAQWGNAKIIIRFVVGLVLAAIVIALRLSMHRRY